MPPKGLNLKQRLSALANVPSSPSSPGVNSPNSPAAKRLNFLNAPWGKRHGMGGASIEQVAYEKVQDVMARMIWQAGVDFETKPMVVMNASALPDPREVDYDQLLTQILTYLNLYVESDYTVVFFAAGSRHTPGWNWVWKAYRSLSRKYRKNLKKLYIVHSTFFTKMLFSLAGAIISPKFFRKISYINTLSELALHVPLTQIDIPPAVYSENLKFEREIVMPTPSRSNMFGVPLEELMGYDGEKNGIPRVVKDCIAYLRGRGLEEEGLFRRSPNSVMLRQAKEAYDRGQVVSLETFNDPFLAAVLLKKYLRDLPAPLFREHTYAVIKRCPIPTLDPSDVSAITYIRETLLPQLPPCVYILLSNVLHLMHDVSLRSATNLMDAHNLSIVLCPNLVSSSNPINDVAICAVPGNKSMSGAPNSAAAPRQATLGMVIKICIERYYEIFDEVRDRSEPVDPFPTSHDAEVGNASGSSGNSSPDPAKYDDAMEHIGEDDEDEEIDDAVLVMPLGPSVSNSSGNLRSKSMSTASTSLTPATASGSAMPIPPYKPRQKKPSRTNLRSSTSTPASAHTSASTTSPNHVYPSQSRAKSTISIEPSSPTTKRGTIAVGRGTTRKSSGAGVEAIGVTAAGFFSPPSNSS